MNRVRQVPEQLAALRALFGASAVLDHAGLQARDPGWDSGNFDAFALVRPASPAAVADLVAWCNREQVPFVAQGGRTGLVGGALAAKDTLICDLGALDRIEEIDAETGIAIVQAGVTLAALQQAAAARGLDPAIDLAARGSATIGGMISTNAGGIMAFRAGVMRHRVLGLEVVLADGRVMSDMTRVVKTSAGYDLKQLFIGAEGTLGIVTRAVIKLELLTVSRAMALVALADAASALVVTKHFLARHAGSLCAAEIMWRRFAATTSTAIGIIPSQMPLETPCLLALELSGATFEAARKVLEDELAGLYEEGGLQDAVVASSIQQARRLWEIRERTEVLYRLHPNAPSFDISVPSRAIDSYLARVLPALREIEPNFDPYVFGHLADGNLHLVLDVAGPLDPGRRAEVETAIYRDLAELGGSISAEHGIGVKKRAAYETFVDPVKRDLAMLVKRSLDPNALCNPGKIVADGPAEQPRPTQPGRPLASRPTKDSGPALQADHGPRFRAD